MYCAISMHYWTSGDLQADVVSRNDYLGDLGVILAGAKSTGI